MHTSCAFLIGEIRMENAGLYIHIPFCISKCSYCDFASVPLNDTVTKYISFLLKELEMKANILEDNNIDTIFIGGGTPSAIETIHIGNILSVVNKTFAVAKDAEVTIEINPGTLDEFKASAYKSFGINRISMGIQSFDDSLLSGLGRIHKGEDAINTIKILRAAGFNNINGDFIFGQPDQTLESFLNDLRIASEIGLTHISMYGLIVEDGTLMKKWLDDGKVKLPDEELEREMYHQGIRQLLMDNYSQYEISNFSIKGMECRHNIGYWRLKPYIGAGLAAHSCIDSKRFWNTSNFIKYFEKLGRDEDPLEGEESLDPEMRASEYIILGLRMNEGVDLVQFENKFGFDAKKRFNNVIDKHVKGGLLTDSNTNLRLTQRGMDLSNIVEIDFLP